MLKIVNLSKSYKNKKIIDNICLEIKDGDIFGFIGRNGAGKTTTIKCIVGINSIDEGSILLDNISIKKDPKLFKQKISYIPDTPNLYDNLTGIQYLNFIADIYNVEKNQRKEIILKYAEVFTLKDDLKNLISSYSHGMKQKLLFISAMIHKPEILILDEPFIGLDPIASYKVKNLIQELCKLGCSVFFSTHVLDVAEKICNKIAIIKDGNIIISGSTKEVLKNKSLEYLFMELMENE